MPAYQQVAIAFAGMHDTPVRMIAKGVVKVRLSSVFLAPNFAHSFLNACQHDPPPCNTHLPPDGLQTGVDVAHLTDPSA